MTERRRQKLLTAWRYLLALPRSIWFNHRQLPWLQARRLPLLISHRTVVESFSGTLVIANPKPKMGALKLGFSTYQQTDFRHDRTRLNIRGTLIVNGESDCGAGACISVAEGAVLTLGHNSHIGPKDLVVCHRAITLGDSVRISWCCTLMDTDQHHLVTLDGTVCNPDAPIVIGRNVWVGCHAIVAKGTQLADDTTIGAGSIVHGLHTEPCTVLSGNPAKVVKSGVRRGNG